MSADGDSLGRWARRKAEAGQPAPAAAPAQDEDAVDAAFVAALPSIDAIDATTDLRGFLRNGVPAALRNAALARAWMADPAIRDRVPDAIDYAENYNAPHTISGWGHACPQEAQSYVERALETISDAPEPGRAVAMAEDAAPAPAPGPEHSSAAASGTEPTPAGPPPAVMADAARPNRGQITKIRTRHGSALPQDG